MVRQHAVATRYSETCTLVLVLQNTQQCGYVFIGR